MATTIKVNGVDRGGLWMQGKLNGKVGSVFGSSSRHRTAATNRDLVSLYNTLAHLGLTIVSLVDADGCIFQAGTPYGAAAVLFNKGAPAMAADLAVARFQSKRVASASKALRSG
jgi:NAD(P)H dehydrogenase (quinone)